MDTIHTPRKKNKLIESYLVKELSSFTELDYEINENFHKKELYQVLIEDLPQSELDQNKKAFVEDICTVTTDFYKNSISKKLRVQLKIVTSDMCRLFHADHNKQRLLCTYHGPGTEWLDENNVNRAQLGRGDNSKIVRDFLKVNQAKEFDLLLLKGKLFSKNSVGSVHRSPAINGANPKRILLKIDEY